MEKNLTKGSRLVILTTHFGDDFSGGSRATCEIFSRLENYFQEIIVVARSLGNHPFKRIRFLPYSNLFKAYSILKSFNKNNTIFYGDFYNAYLFIMANCPFYFTYHDNWPELRDINFSNYLRSFFYVPVYHLIFKNAQKVFTVSELKKIYIQKFNQQVYLIRNGINNFSNNGKSPTSKRKILMAGTVEERKYNLALDLFSLWKGRDDITIDIYGYIQDRKLAKKLKQFNFVRLMGFFKEIPYTNYKLFLHTSFMENPSIVIPEAIYNKLPVVAFHVGGIPEVIGKGNGKLIPPYNIHLMKSTIDDFITSRIFFENDTSHLAEFSWDIASKKYAENLPI